MSEQDRRNFSRIEYNAKVLIEQGEHKSVGSVIELSLNGVLIDSKSKLDVTQPVDIQIIIDEFSPAIHQKAEIVHHQDQQYGLKTLEIDIDSMLQLRTIISMHNDDPDDIHRESKALWEIKVEEKDSETNS
ncbi:PilZ domain-containing protein [Kangiella aquimarina]|uniref:Cyclic diguanosine monophosphate-binding protein n=1 Tax=Kangiella aquimarina TaxID=261965 RepID=A0ABZ0X6A2_9GAMM|nr:PilZ domain-containing protein [Kangiella aquimarina]WQG86121.1 PilZ domain-containing protein [Kangiella aquimarina]